MTWIIRKKKGVISDPYLYQLSNPAYIHPKGGLDVPFSLQWTCTEEEKSVSKVNIHAKSLI